MVASCLNNRRFIDSFIDSGPSETPFPLLLQGKNYGGEGRNRPDFPAVAPLICLISLGIQAKSVLSARIVFNPFGVRFGVRLPISNL